MKYVEKFIDKNAMRKYDQNFARCGLTRNIAEKFFLKMAIRPIEAYQLFCYAKKIPNGGTYLEIGSYIGGSLICVSEAIKLTEKTINLIGIELNVKPELLNNIKSIPNLRLIKIASDLAINEISDDSVDLLFLDGNHHYEQVRQDILNYWPKIKESGVLLGHDYDREGVARAANEILGDKLIRPSRIFRVDKWQDERKNEI